MFANQFQFLQNEVGPKLAKIIGLRAHLWGWHPPTGKKPGLAIVNSSKWTREPKRKMNPKSDKNHFT